MTSTFMQSKTAKFSGKENVIMRKLKFPSALLLSGLLMALMTASSLYAQLPDPGVTIDPARTALVITDPQNDFLSPEGVTWGVVGQSVTENNTVANIESLLKATKKANIPVFVSPHYYYPTDHGWKDWLERYKKYIQDDKTIVVSPHKVYGPETNDLVLQLRKRGIDKIILAGMSANLCVEAHLRELLEQGFEVAVVKDATAAAMVPEGNGYEAALVNFRFLANDVWTTEEALKEIKQSADKSYQTSQIQK
jgi:nicotinamidase-related amidase